MKKLIYAFLAGAVMTGCSSEEWYGQEAPVLESAVVTVTDAGYNSKEGSRAVENGYMTTFTEGDTIGVYAVVNGAVNENVNNLRLVAKEGENGSLTWETADGAGIPLVADAEYHAYYPYKENLPAGVNAAGGEEFFKSVVENWSVAEDQSDYANYTASDLMTVSGVKANGLRLDFNLSHKMHLACVKLPVSKYVFTNTPALPEYVIYQAKDVKFSGLQPYNSAASEYRFIVNPASAISVSGSYKDGSDTRRFSFAVQEPKGGIADTYTVDRNKGFGVKSHLLQVGDFMLSDGSLMSVDATYDEVTSSDVVGVVFCIDPSRIGEAEKEALGGKAHGHVMSAKNLVMGKVATFMWSNYQVDEPWTNNIEGSNREESYELADKEISGYGLYKALLESKPDDVASGKYPAFSQTVEHHGEENANIEKLREATTGWYLPAIGQWFDIIRGLGKYPLSSEGMGGPRDLFYWQGLGSLNSNINDAMEKIDSAKKDKIALNNYYWTANESGDMYAYYLCVTDGQLGANTFSCFANRKTAFTFVRPVLTF